MKIAWLTPFSRRSAIGHCSAVIVDELARRAEVIVFASDLAGDRDPECWLPDADVRGMLTMSHEQMVQELAGCDARVYHLGDNLEFHRAIYDLAQAAPGMTVLHDVVMHHFFTGYYLLHRRDPNGYIDEATFSHGREGQSYARAVLAGAGIDLMQDPDLLRFNMAKSAIHRSEGVVVHSAFAWRTIASVAEAPVMHIPFPAPRMAMAMAPDRSAGRQGSNRKVRLLTFGTVNPNKLIAEVIAVIAASAYLRQRVEYRIIGSLANEGYARQVRRAIEEAGLQDAVELMGHRSEEELQDALAQADLVINLRNPHFGESSWSLLEASFAGKPTMVWQHGFYDEFPDNAVAKVVNLSGIGPRLEELCRDRRMRLRLGQRAREFALRTFSTTQYCDRLLAFAERTRHNRPVLRLTDTVASGLAELGQPPGSAAMKLALEEITAFLPDASDDGEAVGTIPIGGGRDT